jgi:hypothetical protein
MTADAEEPSCGLQHVEEAGELKHLVDQVASSAGEAAEAVFPRFAQIVSGGRRRQQVTHCCCWGPRRCCPPRPALRLTAPPSLPLLSEQVSKYQEQPQLLDPLLEDAVQPLTTLLRAAAADPAAADLQRVRGVSRLLWQLSVVRWGPTGTLPPCCPLPKQDRRNYRG